MVLTANEQAYLVATTRRIDTLARFLSERPSPTHEATTREWYTYLSSLKAILGNASNGMSFVATLMAKDYLSHKLPMKSFDAAAKPQGAPGLDIDERTMDGKRVVAEIKTTTPYQGSDLGAQQKATFKKDFDKLRQVEAEHKFFFVTEQATFEIVKRRYIDQLHGVKVVLLTTGEEHDGSRRG